MVTERLYGNLDLLPSVLPYGLVVRIPAFHAGGPGSIPGVGTCFCQIQNIVSPGREDLNSLCTGSNANGNTVTFLGPGPKHMCVGRESNPGRLLGRQPC